MQCCWLATARMRQRAKSTGASRTLGESRGVREATSESEEEPMNVQLSPWLLRLSPYHRRKICKAETRTLRTLRPYYQYQICSDDLKVLYTYTKISK